MTGQERIINVKNGLKGDSISNKTEIFHMSTYLPNVYKPRSHQNTCVHIKKKHLIKLC